MGKILPVRILAAHANSLAGEIELPCDASCRQRARLHGKGYGGRRAWHRERPLERTKESQGRRLRLFSNSRTMACCHFSSVSTIRICCVSKSSSRSLWPREAIIFRYVGNEDAVERCRGGAARALR